MKKWGIGKIIIVTIIALAVLVLAGYFFGEKPSAGGSSGTTSIVSDTASHTTAMVETETPNDTK